jgi:hypothetical protein
MLRIVRSWVVIEDWEDGKGWVEGGVGGVVANSGKDGEMFGGDEVVEHWFGARSSAQKMEGMKGRALRSSGAGWWCGNRSGEGA